MVDSSLNGIPILYTFFYMKNRKPVQIKEAGF